MKEDKSTKVREITNLNLIFAALKEDNAAAASASGTVAALQEDSNTRLLRWIAWLLWSLP